MKLSIIIAAYNVEKYINKCIKSCINQAYDSDLYEIIVVNDGSNDCTLDILNKLQDEYSNLSVVNQKNMGLGASRNTGIQHSKGTFLWFVDGDDYLESNILSSLIKKIEIDNLEALALDFSIVDEKHNLISKEGSGYQIKNSIVSGPAFYEENFEKSYTVLFIFKKSLFNEGSLLFKEKINMQDSEILPKLLLNVERMSLYNSKCYFYVQHQNSYTNTSNGLIRYEYFKSIIEVKESLNNFLTYLQGTNQEMTSGLEKKIESLNKVVFYHLVFFRYEKNFLVKSIELLKKSGFYPLSYNPKGKLVLVKLGMNYCPIITKKIIDFYHKLKSN